jgi:saccharopine dehydrogenase-like NADP-dependent oxidoreductase
MNDLDKLTKRLMDWLLYNYYELGREILHTEYQGSSKLDKDFAGQRVDNTYSFVEKFIVSQDYHVIIVETIQHTIFTLDSDYFDIYSMRYIDHKEIEEIANMISVNEKTVRRTIQYIRWKTWWALVENMDLLGEEAVLESLTNMRQKYWYIPKEKKEKATF